MKEKKGFTLIELMLVVIIVGTLATLAIPRFSKAAKKAKIAEARSILKQIYQCSMSYYEEHGQWPPVHTFNDVSTQDYNWDPIYTLAVHAPTMTPRFSYSITGGGTDEFEVIADPSNSFDKTLNDVGVITIDRLGKIEGGI